MSRGGIGNFFLVAGAGFAILGFAMLAMGGAAGIAGLTFALIGVIWVIVALGLRGLYGGMAKRRKAEVELFNTGRRATARITSVETTGMVMNNVNQQVVILLEVQPPGEAPFEHQRKMFVPFHGMPRVGDLIEVAYDPADKSRVALQFDPRSNTGGGQLLITRRPGEEAVPAGIAPSSAPAQAAPAAAAPAQGETVSTAPGRVIDGLERLGRLKEEGILTETEFEVQKAKLLSGQDV